MTQVTEAVNTSLLADEYLARHPEILKSLEDPEDEYSVLPYKNKNFDDALKLLEEEMSREYGDGKPFIDPGSLAYDNFDYNDQAETLQKQPMNIEITGSEP